MEMAQSPTYRTHFTAAHRSSLERHGLRASACGADDETIENLKRNRRQDKQIDRRDAVDVILEKRPPSLRRWPRTTAHIAGDRRLGQIRAYRWCSPPRIGCAIMSPNRWIGRVQGASL